jgi:hypothetical protein
MHIWHFPNFNGLDIRILPIKQKAPIKFAYHYVRQHKKGKNEKNVSHEIAMHGNLT